MDMCLVATWRLLGPIGVGQVVEERALGIEAMVGNELVVVACHTAVAEPA